MCNETKQDIQAQLDWLHSRHVALLKELNEICSIDEVITPEGRQYLSGNIITKTIKDLVDERDQLRTALLQNKAKTQSADKVTDNSSLNRLFQAIDFINELRHEISPIPSNLQHICNIDVDYLELLAKQATSGQWVTSQLFKDEYDFESIVIGTTTDPDGETSGSTFVEEAIAEVTGFHWDCQANAKFIAAACPQVVLELIRRLKIAEANK